MTTLWDNPRPKGYWPGTPSQWREPTVDDCTWYATEFGFEAASETHLSMHPVKDLRNFSSDTVGGTPLSVALRETARLWPAKERVHSEYGAYSRRFIMDALSAGAVLVYGGDYEVLPPHYRRWTYNDYFDHAVASKTLDRTDLGTFRTFMYDPLGGGRYYEPYDGEWITIDGLLKYCWQSGDKYWVSIIENKGAEPMKSLNINPNQMADKEVRVRNTTVVRAQPRITGDRTRRIYSNTKWWPVVGRVAGGWRLIAWKNELGHVEWGYINPDDILEYRNEPFTDTDNDALLNENLTLASENAALETELGKYKGVVESISADLEVLDIE